MKKRKLNGKINLISLRIQHKSKIEVCLSHLTGIDVVGLSENNINRDM